MDTSQHLKGQTMQNSGMLVSPQKLNWSVLLPMFVVMATDAIAMAVVLPLLPFYTLHMGASPFMLGVLIAVFSLCQFISGPILGRLSDRYGRKPILLFTQVGMLISLVMLATANSLAMVFIARMISGLTAGHMSVASAYAIDNSSKETKKQAIGIVSMGVGLGLVIGPTLSTFAGHLSLQAPIWIAAAISLLSIVLNLLLLKHQPVKSSSTPDQPQQKLTITPEFKSIFIQMSVYFLILAIFMGGLALYLGAEYQWQGQPFNQVQVGVIFSLAGLLNIVTQLGLMKPLSRYFSDRMLVTLSFSLIALAFVLLSLSHSLYALGFSMTILWITMAILRPTLSAELSNLTQPEQQGWVMGISQSAMAVMNIVGPLISGALINQHWYFGWTILLALIALLGLGLNLFWHKHSQQQQNSSKSAPNYNP